jgi:FAD/FMN-containing dehydrogenase
VITEASLKVRPAPEAIARISAFFNRIDKAGAAVSGNVMETGRAPILALMASLSAY